MAGCQVPECNVPSLAASKADAFLDQDMESYMGDWASDYLMVDSVGVTPPLGSDRHAWQRKIIAGWASRLRNFTRPVVYHSCHAGGCGGVFSGPTLIASRCNSSDPSQLWHVQDDLAAAEAAAAEGGDASSIPLLPLRNEGPGLCVGCPNGPCANDAKLSRTNGSLTGSGIGMQACLPGGLGAQNQQWVLTSTGSLLSPKTNSCLAILPRSPIVAGSDTIHAAGAAPVLSMRASACASSATAAWTRGKPGRGGATPLQSSSDPALCLSPGPVLQGAIDPFCTASASMWRTSTDTLQTWSRTMMQLESLVGMGRISGPGHWAFPDALELGVPGGGVLTFEESKSHLALWSVTSSPLFIANDLRPGYVQDRLLGILRNPTMMAVNQGYDGFAGDRIATEATGKEIWAKPLRNHTTAVVLFNRNGTTYKCMAASSIEAPCDDVPNATSGAQAITLLFDQLADHTYLSPLPAAEALKLSTTTASGGRGSGAIACDIVDVYGPTGASSIPLGRFVHNYTTVVPPHGSAFLIVGNCSTAMNERRRA
jgi:hypothetical protein